MNAPQPETIADGLLAQHKLLLAVIHTDWATRLDHKVAATIIERFMRKQGNARASLRYLERATGSQRNKIITSTRRLLEHGVFSVMREGSGTRATEYALNFQFSPSGTLEGTTSIDLASGTPEGTPCGTLEGTANASSGTPEGTKTYLLAPADKPADKLSRNDDTPEPPASDGLAATAQGSRDPFERFWKSYPRKYQKPKARSAWDKLAPDADLADRIIAAAGEWAEHYAKHPVDKKWMPAPANWLAGERFDEDLPEVYVDAKEAAIAKKATAKTSPPADNDDEAVEPIEWIGDISPFVTPGRHLFKIAAATITDVPGKYGKLSKLDLVLDMEDGGCISGLPHRLHIQDDDPKIQARDHARFERIGFGVEFEEDLVGRTFYAMVTLDGRMEYERPAA